MTILDGTEHTSISALLAANGFSFDERVGYITAQLNYENICDVAAARLRVRQFLLDQQSEALRAAANAPEPAPASEQARAQTANAPFRSAADIRASIRGATARLETDKHAFEQLQRYVKELAKIERKEKGQ